MNNESHGEKPKEVSILIDKKEYKSPDQTTGATLYTLGNINGTEFDLWEEIKGHGEDILIPNDTTKVDLKNGTHFYSIKKHITPGSIRD